MTVCAEVSVPAIIRSMHRSLVMSSLISPVSSWASITSTRQVGADRSRPGRLRASCTRDVMMAVPISDCLTASLSALLGRNFSQGI